MDSAQIDFEFLALTANDLQRKELPDGLMTTPVEKLFPRARDAKAALAGILLHYGHWDLSHQVSQDIESREGSYWHAIAHRIEPDSWNSGYWFRKVGDHPIFKVLYEEVKGLLADAKVGWGLKQSWDPALFIAWCDEARGLPGSEKDVLARRIQRIESAQLFSWCVTKS
jgi:hypothetical protein